jgi:predicted aspartyl protease
MPICTIPYDAASGAEIDIYVSKPGSTYTQEEVITSRRKLRLLIDTGASKTAINPKHIWEMQLLPSGKQMMRTAIGEKEVNLYPVDLLFDIPQPPLIISDLTIMEFPSSWRDGVLGRDFLEKIILEINGIQKYIKLII